MITNRIDNGAVIKRLIIFLSLHLNHRIQEWVTYRFGISNDVPIGIGRTGRVNLKNKGGHSCDSAAAGDGCRRRETYAIPQFGDLITADSMKTVQRRFENEHVILLLKLCTGDIRMTDKESKGII